MRIPIEWDEDAECPTVNQFFGEVFPSDAIELAYEILGYMLYNDNPLHKAILLYGSGRNGKGTFIRLARMLVGHNNISAVTPQALDSSQFSSAQLYGKLANLVGDVDPRIFKSTEQFKQLTGGDYMMAQHKHKDPFVFVPYHHPRWVGWNYREYLNLYRQADALIALTQVEKQTLVSLGVAEERIFVTGFGPIIAEQAYPDQFRKQVRPSIELGYSL